MRNTTLSEQARVIDEMDEESRESFGPFDSTSKSTTISNGEDSVQPLVTKENRRIFLVRVVLGLVLIAATVATSYVIYKATKDGEDEQFVASFQDSALKLIDEFEASLGTTIAAIDNFAIVSATQQQSNEKNWPFVVTPKFEIGGSSTRHLAGASTLSVIPFVPSPNRAAWEAFTVNNSAWVQEGKDFDSWTPHGHSHTAGSHTHMRRKQRKQRQLEGHDPVEFENDIATTIFSISEQDHFTIVDIDRPYYLPVWQNTPVRPQLVNYNLFSHGSFGQAGALVINTSSVVFGLVADVSDIHDPFNFLYHAEEHHGYDFGDISHQHDEEGADDHDDHDHDHEEEEHEEGHEEEGHEEEGHAEDGHEEDGHGEEGHEEEGHEKESHAEESHAEEIHGEEEHEEDGHLEEGRQEDGHEDEEGHDDHEDDHVGEEEAHTGKIGDVAHQHDHGQRANDFGDPLSMTYFPIFDQIEEPRNVVGFVSVVIYWRDFLVNVLPPNAQPVLAVLENECGQQFSFVVIGEDVLVAGEGDFHESKYDHMEDTFYMENLADAKDLTFSGVPLNVEYCPYHLRVFPTSQMEDHYHTNKPGAYAGGVVAVFLFAIVVFLLYDYLVTRRQAIVAQKAKETTAVVNSLFPARVRDRLFQKGEDNNNNNNNKDAFLINATLTGMRISGGVIPSPQYSNSIADLFPEATVLFADICGFTAWSSSREPCQVFALLENVYGKFDAIARKEAVFKVETIGDCYVAVTGVPEPQSDHAIRMARFAQKCLEKLSQLTKILEVSLGPDTANLAMRFGLHSGPVTAGVLRGERARFQLFGDTVNTASRMESTGVPNRIHCSKSTADLLSEEWVTKRIELVEAKGKGQIQTYWIVPRSFSSPEMSSQKGSNESVTAGGNGATFRVEKTGEVIDSKIDRMVDWNVDLLLRLLQEVVASRNDDLGIERAAYIPRKETNNPIAEISDTFVVSQRQRGSYHHEQKPSSVDLGPDVMAQLRDYIASIAYMYKDNPFHNFDHASHVTMSAQKLLNRAIVNWQTSDPLTHFAVIFSTVIHDVDHRGLPNFLLAEEDYDMANQYNEKSIAEQNSIDVAWELLMAGAYEDLRKCIFTNEDEYRQFRSQVVNMVLATDIFDKDLKALRNKRWETAFGNSNSDDEHSLLKGSIVLEHLIQASDVSHTMQHWHVFLKWNQKLFNEMYKAFENGRGNTDPSQGWYKGELWFFDNYVIPLARRLKECGVFGVFSDEYLNYAEQNRREWESKGESIVAQWVAAKPAIQPAEVTSTNSQLEVTSMGGSDTDSGGGEVFC